MLQHGVVGVSLRIRGAVALSFATVLTCSGCPSERGEGGSSPGRMVPCSIIFQYLSNGIRYDPAISCDSKGLTRSSSEATYISRFLHSTASGGVNYSRTRSHDGVVHYCNDYVGGQLKDSEQRIEQSRIWSWEFESHGETDIRCPRCGRMLKWHGTGVS